MSQGDYDGAITNAWVLVEAVLAAIEKEFDPNAPDYDGDLPKLYKRVQKHLNLSPENPKISNSLKQTLTGFISIIGGLSGSVTRWRPARSRIQTRRTPRGPDRQCP